MDHYDHHGEEAMDDAIIEDHKEERNIGRTSCIPERGSVREKKPFKSPLTRIMAAMIPSMAGVNLRSM